MADSATVAIPGLLSFDASESRAERSQLHILIGRNEVGLWRLLHVPAGAGISPTHTGTAPRLPGTTRSGTQVMLSDPTAVPSVYVRIAHTAARPGRAARPRRRRRDCGRPLPVPDHQHGQLDARPGSGAAGHRGGDL